MEGNSTGTGVLPRSRFCSDTISPADRFVVWSESVAQVGRPYLADGVAAADCAITTDAVHLGESILVTSSTTGIGGYRNPGSSPLRETPDMLMIQYYRRGGGTGCNGGQDFSVVAQDIVILDLVRGHTLVAEHQSDALSFMVPRQLLQPLIGAQGGRRSLVISGQSLPGQILASSMLSLWEALPQMAPAEAQSASNLLLGAFAGLLRGSVDADTAGPVEHATLNAICAYIERHLGEPELGPDLLCRQFHLSRARLYRLFAPLDGVANHIRRLRLERCHTALLTATPATRISDVALEWGFGSISHFNRAFRAAYGMAPGELRESAWVNAATTTRSHATQHNVPAYRDWLARL